MSTKMGRPAIFPGKDLKKIIKGHTTKTGKKAFEEARSRLAKIAGWKVRSVSDGDVIEYLSRGHLATVDYLYSQGVTLAGTGQ
jgi:hypothetical protein